MIAFLTAESKNAINQLFDNIQTINENVTD